MDHDLKYVLEFCQDIISKEGGNNLDTTRLIPGSPGKSDRCVIARTIQEGLDRCRGDVMVNKKRITVYIKCGSGRGYQRYETPPKIKDFINMYDLGVYQDLIRKR